MNCAGSTYSERRGVRVEDVETEFLQSLFKHHVHHGVLLTVLRVQVTDLKQMTPQYSYTPCGLPVSVHTTTAEQSVE